ncbi:MAG: GNAT family N-acetyltransferase [Sandaracinaceae bacterium]
MQPTDSDVARLGELFQRNDDPKDMKALRWRYLENPTGRVFVDLALDDAQEAVAGAYCVSPAYFRLGGRRVLGVQSIDTLTDARYRGKGLFQRLAQSCYGRCAEQGASLVYGFPNQHSAFGFFERLGWTRLDPVPFLIRPLRAQYLATRMRAPSWVVDRLPRVPLASTADVSPPRGQELRVVEEFDEGFDRLWAEFARDVDVALERDSAYLRWRFSANPHARYKTLAVFERGEMIAYAVFCVADKHGGRVGYVMELLHLPGRWNEARLALRQAVVEIARAGSDVVLAWCLDSSPNRRAYRAEGFLTLPERVRPIELHFGARHLESSEVAVCNRKSWYLSYCDSDTV